MERTSGIRLAVAFVAMLSATVVRAGEGFLGTAGCDVCSTLTEPPTAPCAFPEKASESPIDNLSLFAGIEASRQPQDLGINANFGAALSANLGLALIPDAGIGLQLGTGFNLSKAGVKVLRVVEGTRDRQQWFNTVGLFKRADDWYIGAVYDCEYSNYYNTLTAGQIRGEVGLKWSENDTGGLWGTVAVHGDTARILDTEYRVRPISQLSVFWNRRWMTGAQTRVWLGVAGSHGTDIVLLPDDHRSGAVAVFGLQVFVPLTENLALFGQGNFVTPSDTGTLDAYLGFAYFFGGATRSRTNRFAPVLPVANNPTLALDLRREW